MRTAVYIRVSTDDQAREGFSIPAQREKLLAYVHSQDWTVSDLYVDEGASAKDTNRPELARLLADVRSGGIDVVLVYRLDRLTRSVLDLYRLLQEFEEYGVRFKSCTEVYDTTTAMGRLFITLVAALAQWERENLGERVRLGMEQMVKERKRPGGPPPYGYELADGKLAVHPEEASVVRMMFESYNRGESPRSIAEHANRGGARGKNGARWSAGAVLRLLKNPVYYGALRWNFTDSGQRQNAPDEWLLEEAAHPAIVGEDLFRQVQDRIGQRGSRHPRVLSSSLLFSGLLYCSRCGSPMRGKTARIGKRDGGCDAHTYYTCRAKRTGACDAAAIREDLLELALIGQLLLYPQPIREAAAAAWNTARLSAGREAGSVEAELSVKRRRWEKAYEEGLITLPAFRAKLDELDDLARKASRPLLRSAPSDTACGQADSGCPTDYRALLDWREVWSFATREEKRQLITTLVERLDAEALTTSRRNRQVRLTHLLFR